MNFEDMSIEELKETAKKYDIKAGNIGREKLIEKIKSAQNISNINSIDDFTEETPAEAGVESLDGTSATQGSALDSILSAVDELDESDGAYEKDDAVDLPMDMVVPVKSFTFGGLIYKSPQNNSQYRWNEIGAIQNMTIAQIIEMNNYSTDYLYKPYVILADEKAVRYFRLTKVYENVAKISNLKELFKKPVNVISQIIDDILALNMRDILISKVRTMYNKKTLTDIRIIRLLSEKLQFDFAD